MSKASDKLVTAAKEVLKAYFKHGLLGDEKIERLETALKDYQAQATDLEEMKSTEEYVRDYSTDIWRHKFAGRALQALMSGGVTGEPAKYAELAVKFADALLAELEKPRDKT